MRNRRTTGTIFITSWVWPGPWLGIEPGTSCTRSQHFTTRLSKRLFKFILYIIVSITSLPYKMQKYHVITIIIWLQIISRYIFTEEHATIYKLCIVLQIGTHMLSLCDFSWIKSLVFAYSFVFFLICWKWINLMKIYWRRLKIHLN